MDGIATTGASSEGESFRVPVDIVGVESAAQLFPRIDGLPPQGIADLESGRKVHFQECGDETPLVPLATEDAESFDPVFVPVEEIPEFVFADGATDEDVQALISIRNADEPDAAALDILERLEHLGWVSQDATGVVALTPLGAGLLCHRLA